MGISSIDASPFMQCFFNEKAHIWWRIHGFGVNIGPVWTKISRYLPLHMQDVGCRDFQKETCSFFDHCLASKENVQSAVAQAWADHATKLPRRQGHASIAVTIPLALRNTSVIVFPLLPPTDSRSYARYTAVQRNTKTAWTASIASAGSFTPRTVMLAKPCEAVYMRRVNSVIIYFRFIESSSGSGVAFCATFWLENTPRYEYRFYTKKIYSTCET